MTIITPLILIAKQLVLCAVSAVVMCLFIDSCYVSDG